MRFIQLKVCGEGKYVVVFVYNRVAKKVNIISGISRITVQNIV